MKMPALQFYPADWRKDPGVQSLGYFDRGVWFEMLCMMHESSDRGFLLLNGIPMPEEALANALGLDNQILQSSLTKLLTYGVAKRRQSDGAIYNKRMVEDEKLCKVRREAGKKGGNPALLNQNSTTLVNQNPTPSSSSSSSSSEETILVGKTDKPTCPHQEIIGLYHEILPELPGVKSWTGARQKKLKSRWDEDRSRQKLEFWENYFKYVKTCKFLLGKNDRNWTANLDFLVTESKFVKVIEGEYEFAN